MSKWEKDGGEGERLERGKSAREIEERITSKSTVTWDPFTVFPKQIDFKLINLVELTLTIVSADDFDYLENLKPSSFLRKLTIIINLHKKTGDIWFALAGNDKWDDFYPEWKTIWGIIEEKFPALVDLNLSLPRQPDKEAKRRAINQSLIYRLNLKKLKRLSILLPNLCCLDFLQEMRGLQELKIDYLHNFQDPLKYLDKVKLNEKVQFNQDLSKMWGSNIWKLFPNLRKLSVRVFGLDERKRRVFEVHLYEKGEKDKKYNKTIQNIPQDSHYIYYL